MEADLLCTCCKEPPIIGIGQSRHRIGVLAWAFKRIATFLNLAVQIAGSTRDACDLFKHIKMFFQFVIGNAPVLNGHIFRNNIAESFLNIGTGSELFRLCTPCHAVPVDTGSANADAGQKRTQLAIGESNLIKASTNR